MIRSLRLSALLLALAALAACTPANVRDSETPASRLAELHLELGASYMREGKYDLALNRLQRALEADPSSAAAHNAIALLYERLNEESKAEEHYKDAVRLKPDFSPAHTNYGSFLCKTNRPAQAEAQFQAAVKNPLYDTPEVAYTNAGLCMLRYGEPDKAETYLRDALQKKPTMPIALLSMSELSYNKGRYLPARGYLQRYQEVGSPTAESLWLGVRIEKELGDKNALSSYEMLLRNNFPDSRETRMLEESSEK